MKMRNIFWTVFLSVSILLPLTNLCAQQSYDIKELTPEVKSALDSRRGRFDELKQLKAQGVVGENNKGYVEVITHDGDAKMVVDAENKDRNFIYKTIAEQNGLPSDALSTIETVFAQVQRNKAVSGDKIQNPDGSWATKE